MAPPRFVRVSLGSAITLGLTKGSVQAAPSAIYLLTFHDSKCFANCLFCAQARSSTSRSDLLSRVTWPTFSTKEVLSSVQELWNRRLIRRVCIQSLNYADAFTDVLNLVESFHLVAGLPISLSSQPFRGEQLQSLADAGLQRIGIPLDTATEDLFSRIKGHEAGGAYTWNEHLDALKMSVEIFGKGFVSTHFIVGLGETDTHLISIIQKMVDIGVHPGLFAFTPIPGTHMEDLHPPPLSRYRKIQVAHYLITKGIVAYSMMKFDQKGDLMKYGIPPQRLKETIASGDPFLTSGCPDCNRPFYNEKVRGPLYNYPRRPTQDELAQIEVDLLIGDTFP